MLFSILIAHYNNARFLEDALKSVVGQSYSDWEIIMVDDASTDDYKKVIAPYLADPRIRFFHNEQNRGCGYTKRKCVDNAAGSILGFLDPDDSLDPEALSKMVAAHRNKPECSLIHSTHYVCDAEMKTKRIAEYVRALPDTIPYLLLNDGRIHHFASFKKVCYDKTAGISSVIQKAVDQDLYYKLEETGSVFFIDEPLYKYRIHGGSISTYGREKEATKWHYSVIEEACRRRISELRKISPSDFSVHWTKRYKTKYYKTKVFSNFRSKNWFRFIFYLGIYAFAGGWGNLTDYAGKLRRNGSGILRKSFVEDYQIKT